MESPLFSLENLDYLFSIPETLLPIIPFVEEAQEMLRRKCISKVQYFKRLHVALVCLDQAFVLMGQIRVQLDDEARKVISKISVLREQLSGLIAHQKMQKGFSDDIMTLLSPPFSRKDFRAFIHGDPGVLPRLRIEEILFIEAKSALMVADDEYKMGFLEAASVNYHCACVFLKTFMSFVLTSKGYRHEYEKIIQMKAEAAVMLPHSCTQLFHCSKLVENLVCKHFTDDREFCDYYEMVTQCEGGPNLGQGSYGTVFLCRHKQTGDLYACKNMISKTLTAYTLRKWHSEIMNMTTANHPNIVRLHEVFFSKGSVYMILDLCNGGELYSFMTDYYTRGCNEHHAAMLLRDIIMAVKHLHSVGIVHRDLKLENFMFEKCAVSCRLKLIDFGLSKRSLCATSSSIVGSAYYMAPEVIKRDAIIDYRQSDVWSLGVVSYMILSGCPPFYGSTKEEIYEMICKADISFSPERFQRISSSALDFVARMMNKDPRLRLSLEGALQHPFLTKANELAYGAFQDSARVQRSIRILSSKAPTPQLLSCIAEFLKLPSAKKIFLVAVASVLTPVHLAGINEDFYSFDIDCNGTISIKKVSDFLGVGNNSSQVDNEDLSNLSIQSGGSMINDLDRWIHLNYVEFTAAMIFQRIHIDDKHVQRAFDKLDGSGFGILTKKWLATIISCDIDKYGDIDTVFYDFDLDGDGIISFNDFFGFWQLMNIKTSNTWQKKKNPLVTLYRSLKAMVGYSSSSRVGDSSVPLPPTDFGYEDPILQVQPVRLHSHNGLLKSVTALTAFSNNASENSRDGLESVSSRES